VKKVKAGKIREMAVTEFGKRAVEIREELFKLRFQHATGQLENPVRMRTLRRELARVLTVQHEQAAGRRHADGQDRGGEG
jgi:large subunit ribosomal protein L29